MGEKKCWDGLLVGDLHKVTACIHYSSIHTGLICFESIQFLEPVYTSIAGSIQFNS